MATISLSPIRGSGILKRASVNGFQFIEAEILRGGGVLPDVRVGSSSNVHSVLGWIPENNSTDNEINRSVAVNFEADNTNELDLEYSSGIDFDNLGNHDKTVSITNGVALDTNSPRAIFDDYTTGLSVQDIAQPQSWFKTSTKENFVVADDSYNWDGKHLFCYTGNNNTNVVFDEAGLMESGEVRFQFMKNDWTGSMYVSHSIMMNVTGSGTAMRGHYVKFGGQYVSLRRILSSTADTYVPGAVSLNLGTNDPKTLEVWNGAVRFISNGSGTTSFYCKCWIDTGSEPSSWFYMGTDTAYVGAGWVGIDQRSGYYTGYGYYDNFIVAPIPPVYNSSGTWTSDPIDVSSVETLASSRIRWEETIPENTTAAVKCRWRDGALWLTCSNDESLPGIEYRESLRPGSIHNFLEFRVELTTTDTSETPSVENVEIEFDPCLFEDCELIIRGESATIENGNLWKWGREQVSGGVPFEAFDDLWIQGISNLNYLLNGESILAEFKFLDYLLGEITFSQLLQAYKFGTADGYFGFLGTGGQIESSGNFQWTARNIWTPSGGTFQWTLIDKTQGIHADGWYWVGFAKTDDFPGSITVAHPQITDFPGTVLAKAYKRDDFPGTILIQGWRHDDFFGTLLPARTNANDFPGAITVGRRHVADFPGAILVYGVNRGNEIDISTIRETTRDELEALGFILPPEAP